MGAAATGIAERRQTDPVSLRRLVDGDLNSIAMKALEKARERRYASVSDLAADIQRHMEDRPVLASPPGRRYRARKFLRRHKQAALGIAAGVVVLVLSAVTVWSLARDSVRRPRLTGKDTIVLADFDNKTGDPVFDDTLRQGLSVEVQQSPFLALISDRKIQQTLTLMGRPKDARLNSEVAQQICERTGSAAVLEGSIASLGSQYVLGLRAKDCSTGNILDQQQAVAAKREDVLNSLGEIARKFRTRVGESLATVERHSTPLAEATTPSFDALKAYSTAMKLVLSSGNFAPALPFFRRAVEIDPAFAMAHAQLGFAYNTSGESVQGARYTREAWLLRDRVSDRERFFIDFLYDRQAAGNLENAYKTLELWRQTYPRRGPETANPQDLPGGLATHGTGRFARTIEASLELEGIAADPDFPIVYSNLALAYFFTDRFSEAESTIQRATARKLEMPLFQLLRYQIAALNGDREQMERAAGLARGRGVAEHRMAHVESVALARSGRLQAARRSSDRAVEVAVEEHAREAAANYAAARAVWEAIFGNAAEAETSAMAALGLSKGRDVEYSAYVRGESLIAAHRYAEAAAEFQKILDHRGIVGLDPIGTLAHWQLGRVYASSGDKAKAKAAYEVFLALWKDADRDIPILKSAKAEYARL